MSERHTVDFARCSLNVVTDGDRRTITLQFDNEAPRPRSKPIDCILEALRREDGAGLIARLNRWRTGKVSPFVLPARGRPLPVDPEVLCHEIGVQGGEGDIIDSALGTLLEFLRRQPGYERTYGAPLDRDEVPSRIREGADGDPSTAAHRPLRGLMERRRRPRGAGWS